MLNERFTVPPASSVDAHRPAKGYDLAAILSIQTVRTVANDYTVRHAGHRYQIERRSIAGGLRGSKVIVEERLDGSLRLRFRGRYLRFHEVPPAKALPTPRQPRPGVGASGPPPGPPAPTPYRPPEDHPWRRPFKKKRTFLLCVDTAASRRHSTLLAGRLIVEGASTSRAAKTTHQTTRRSRREGRCGCSARRRACSQRPTRWT